MVCFIGEKIMNKVLVVDDDADLRRLVKTYAENDGFICVEAASGNEALEELSQSHCDSIILDMMIPGKDGLSVSGEIRKMNGPAASTPVILLTARKEEYDKLLGFKLGADDYVPKPFSPAELMARIKAVLRRDLSISGEKMQFGQLEIREKERLVIIDGKEITLRPKEFDLLMHLAVHNHIALSREQLLKAVWEYEYYGDLRTVDTHIRACLISWQDSGKGV
jgi:DNA-binding response OmpR family regulator